MSLSIFTLSGQVYPCPIGFLKLTTGFQAGDNYKANSAAARRRSTPAATPMIVGAPIPASGKVPLAGVDDAVAFAVAVALLVGVGEVPPVPAPIGEAVGELEGLAVLVAFGVAVADPLGVASSVALKVNTNGSHANEV